MQPDYISSDKATIRFFNCDNMLFMKDVPDKFYDLGICDPIYGVNQSAFREHLGSNKLAKTKKYHSSIWRQKKTGIEYFNELLRISKNQIIWGGVTFSLQC